MAFLAVVMVGYIYLFTGAKIKNVSNDVIKGDEETKSLVVYFTRQGVIPGDVDAVSSATQSSNKGMEGSDTEGAARMIQSLTGADMYQKMCIRDRICTAVLEPFPWFLRERQRRYAAWKSFPRRLRMPEKTPEEMASKMPNFLWERQKRYCRNFMKSRQQKFRC